jgi:pyruvate,water dikinase
VALLVAILPALPAAAAAAGAFSSVEPGRIEAGSFYDGATIRVTGTVGARSQVAVRVMGAEEHHTFNRRGKIAGLIWGGVEHVSFERAPSLYAVYTSAALGTVAGPEVRRDLRLGYETLEVQMEVRGTRADKRQMIEQFVRLKEIEGLYRVAPGAIPLADAEDGRRRFAVEVRLPSTAAPGAIEVAVFELADGALVGQDVERVQLERVGMPAFLYELAHERSTMFGLLAVLTLVLTGVAVDMLGHRAAREHPAVVLLTGLVRGIDENLLAARHRPRSSDEVERMHAKYRLFRTLLAVNNEVLENLAELEEESSWTSYRHPRVRIGIRALFDGTADMVAVLNELTAHRYFDLTKVVATLRSDVFKLMEKAAEREPPRLTLKMREIGRDTADQVGDKALGLARMECDLRIRVPDFFVVTIAAYRQFLEADGLAAQLRTILSPARLDAPEDFRRRCEMAQALVRDARVPAAVAEAIRGAHAASGFPEGEAMAVRSSAAGEGSALSFAGQFESLLNVPASRLVEAWKDVVVSRYAPRAVFYRRAAGLAEVDTPMAVIVQRMVRPRASGVLFTRPPDQPKGQVLLVSADQGLGTAVSAGVADADQLAVSRRPPHPIVERRVAAKRSRLAAVREGGVPPSSSEAAASITDAEASRLGEVALGIEHYFGGPQDLEWALGEDGTLFVLQARPLRTEKPEAQGPAPVAAALLLRGGDPVWHGRAVGPVHVARTPREQEATPAGAVLVVPQLLPDCVRLLPRVTGVVVEQGTITGHAASLVREFRIPSLFGVGDATGALASGRLVSLDVASRSVFDGALWPELRGRLPAAVVHAGGIGLPDLLAGKLTKLSGSAFMGTWACRSLHDVVRFAHEKAIDAMFDIGDRLLASSVGGVKRVESDEPLFMHVVDLGGGIRPESAAGETIPASDVVSVPFQALWRGLGDRNFRPRRAERPAVSPSVLAATLAMSHDGQLGAPNYACITDSYLNLASRAGVERDRLRARPRRQACHFVVVDSFLSESPNENHIRMRLKGGGGAPWQRILRAEFAAEVLRLHDLTATVTGDLMNAWIRGIDRSAGATRLATIGRLLRFLSRLDMWMTDEADVSERVRAFVDAEMAALAAAGPGSAAG